MDTLSPFSLPPSMIDDKKRSIVDWHSEGTKVEWSDDEELPQPPKPKKKMTSSKRRVVVASVESFPVAVLAAKRSFESVYFVALDRSLHGQGRGATELDEDPLVAAGQAARALEEPDSVVIFAGDTDRAATVARMAAWKKNFALPIPDDPELRKFCKKLNSMTPVTMRGAFRSLEAFRA